MRDDILHGFLKESNALKILKQQEPYIWDFCDTSVQISSRLALTCMQDQQMICLIKNSQKERSLGSLMGLIRYEFLYYMYFHELIRAISRKDPEHSFLAFRLLARHTLFHLRHFDEIERIIEAADGLITHSPEWVDWDAVDAFYKRWFGWYMKNAYYKSSQSPYYLWNICWCDFSNTYRRCKSITLHS